MKNGTLMLFVLIPALLALMSPALAAKTCLNPSVRTLPPEISALKRKIASPPACAEFDSLKKIPEGTLCLTQAGSAFERTEDGWKDPQGLIWADKVSSNLNQYEAIETCQKKKSRLPSLSEIKKASDQGLDELVQKLQSKRYWYWTTTPDNGYIQLFSLDSGKPDISLPNFKFETYSARCVTQASK